MKNKTVKFKVRNLDYTLHIVDTNNENLILDGVSRAGIAYRKECKIYIVNDLKPQMFARVLLHELSHAFIYASGMVQVEWNEENVADFIENNFEDLEFTLNKILGVVFNE